MIVRTCGGCMVAWIFVFIAFIGYWICMDVLDIFVYWNNIYYGTRSGEM